MPVDNSFKIEKHLKRLTEAALEKTSGNRTEAAQLLGISVRTLRNWINRFSLAKDHPPQNRK